MKRFISIVLGILMISGVLTLTGCGEKKDVNEITIAVNNNLSEKTIITALKVGYEKKYPGRKVTIRSITGDYASNVLQDAAADTLSDILFTQDDTVAFLASKNVFVPLDDYIKRDNVDTSIYYDSVLEIGKPLDDGKMYFMPRDYNKVVTYINKDLFEQAKIAIPTDDWTWEDFKNICSEFRTKIDAGFNGLDTESFPVGDTAAWKAFYYPVIKGFGGELFVDGKLTIDTPKTTAGIKEIVSLHTNKYIMAPSDPYCSSVFSSGQAAMSFSVRPGLPDLVKKINVDVRSFPALPNPVVGMGCAGYGITYQADNKDLAWDFIKYMASEEGQTVYSESGRCVPLIKSMAGDGVWKTKPNGYVLNHDAYIKFPERDIITDYMNGVEPKQHTKIYTEIDRFFSSIIEKGFTEAGYKSEIATIKEVLANFI